MPTNKPEYWLRIRNPRAIKDNDGALSLQVDLYVRSGLSGRAIWSRNRSFDDVCKVLAQIMTTRYAGSSSSILYSPEELAALLDLAVAP